MTTSPEQMSLLSEILEWQPIPEDKLVYFRERLRHRLHAAILDAFLARAEERGLKQKDLAIRIGRKRVQITRWLSTASNLTLDSISDLMVGLAMDFDGFPFTPIEKTLTTVESSPAVSTADFAAPIKAIKSWLEEMLASQIPPTPSLLTPNAGATLDPAMSIERKAVGGRGQLFFMDDYKHLATGEQNLPKKIGVG